MRNETVRDRTCNHHSAFEDWVNTLQRHYSPMPGSRNYHITIWWGSLWFGGSCASCTLGVHRHSACRRNSRHTKPSTHTYSPCVLTRVWCQVIDLNRLTCSMKPLCVTKMPLLPTRRSGRHEGVATTSTGGCYDSMHLGRLVTRVRYGARASTPAATRLTH